jgi:hypothetical protein
MPADQAEEKEGRQRTFGSRAANKIGPEEWKGKEKGLAFFKGINQLNSNLDLNPSKS